MAVLLSAFLIAGWAQAQQLEFSISPSPVGSGARAAGMADAFVAIADDATAASWNPAGLVQLERPEIAIVGEWSGVLEHLNAYDNPPVSSSHFSDSKNINFLSVTYPLPFLVLGRNVVAGVYYQHKYEFGRSLTLRYRGTTATPTGWVIGQNYRIKYDQEGSLSTITAAMAFELTHRLSVGVGANFWRSTGLSDNYWSQRQRLHYTAFSALDGQFGRREFTQEYSDVTGESLTVGLLWRPNSRWTVGMRYDSAWQGEADYRQSSWDWSFRSRIDHFSSEWSYLNPVREKREVKFPATLAIGAACRLNDRWTVSMDVSRTDWNDFWQRKPGEQRFSLVNNASMDDLLYPARFDPTYTVRLGCEYVMIPEQPDETLDWLWTLRSGLFYDQEPASGRPDDFYGMALGLGLLAKQRVNIDLAYQLRGGSGVNEDFIRGLRGFEEDVFQHRLLLSTVIYF